VIKPLPYSNPELGKKGRTLSVSTYSRMGGDNAQEGKEGAFIGKKE